jgi:hypothetical protein
MSRVRIPITVIDLDGDAISGATVAVKLRSSGALATVYQNETGPTTITNPVSTNSQGIAPGWVDRGQYVADVTGTGISPYSEPFEAIPAVAKTRIPWHVDLVGAEPRNPHALTIAPAITTYAAPDHAFSASSFGILAGVTATVVYAVWQLIWTPNNTACGVQLVKMDPGPVNVTQVAEITGLGSTSPIVSDAGATAFLQSIFAEQAAKNIGDPSKIIQYRVKASGAVAPLIYQCRLTAVLEV